MSPCCSAFGEVANEQFNSRIARRDLATYRKSGAGPTTRLLRDLLVETRGLDGDLLDVGSGIGGLTFELLERGVVRAVAVDASAAYLAAASEEAARRGSAGIIRFVQGDFLEIAEQLPAATVVTLDRVVCCYPRYEPLVEESLRLARRYFAFSYPRDAWYVRWTFAAENSVRWLRGSRFRAFVHPGTGMTEVIRRAGFELAARRRTRMWAAEVYTRSSE